MAKVVPSQVRRFIDIEFTYVSREVGNNAQVVQISPAIGAVLSGLVALVRQIPDSLLPSDPADHAALIVGVAAIEHSVALAQTQSREDRSNMGYVTLAPSSPGGWNPVIAIRRALDQCLDEPVPTGSRALLFIADPSVRADLLADMETIRSALLNSEWKPATVIAGAVAEALLLWGIDQMEADLPRALAAAFPSGEPKRDREWWTLEQYIAVAAELSLIEPDTARQLKLAQEFRNLIHPGRSRRKGKRCDLGTALAASAGAAMLSRDLDARHDKMAI